MEYSGKLFLVGKYEEGFQEIATNFEFVADKYYPVRVPWRFDEPPKYSG